MQGKGSPHPAVAGTHEVSWIRASVHMDGSLGPQSYTHGVSWIRASVHMDGSLGPQSYTHGVS
jgi:hypothetical protein